MATTGDGKLKNGVIEFAGANTPGWISNLGLSYSAGTLKIVDAQGEDLSPNNPGFVTVPSTTAGQIVTLKVTTSLSFNDDTHASSNLTGLGFGITESVNWSLPMPFFIYCVNRNNSDVNGVDGNSTFAISRNPCMKTTGIGLGVQYIGDKSSPPFNDVQESCLIIQTVTKANYVGLPSLNIGAFRMTWLAATTDYTVSTLGETDGIGMSALRATYSTRFSFPQGQNGAANTSTYGLNNGGTTPLFSTSTYRYKINGDGMLTGWFMFDGDGGTDGAGAVPFSIVMPYSPGTVSVALPFVVGSSLVTNVSGTLSNDPASIQSNHTANSLSFIVTAGTVNNSDFGNGARNVNGTYTLEVFY